MFFRTKYTFEASTYEDYIKNRPKGSSLAQSGNCIHCNILFQFNTGYWTKVIYHSPEYFHFVVCSEICFNILILKGEI